MAGRLGRVVAGALLAISSAACATATSSTAPSGLPAETASPPDPAAVAAHLAAGLPLFASDPNAAIAVTVDPDAADSSATATAFEVRYMGADGWVSALLVEPASAGLHPAVLLLGGMSGTRRDLLSMAIALADAGVVSLLVDPPGARAARIGPGTQPLNLTVQDRDEQIELVLDLRRAVTLLVGRSEVDQNAIGFLGSGYGADIGGLLAGVDPRLAVSVLEAGDGGLVSHFAALGDASPLATLTPAARTAWIAAMDPIEPLYFVGNATGPVLFQSGIQDTTATAMEGARFAAAGNAKSTVHWYETGHDLGDEASCDAAKFLGDHLGFDGSADSACGTAPARPDSYSWVAIIGLFVLFIVVRLVVRLRRRRPPPPPPDEDEELQSKPIIRVGSERG